MVSLLSIETRSLISGKSPIREMFELGQRLAKVHGRANVFDFSLGNPALDPPAEFTAALSRLSSSGAPGLHSYPPSRGIQACIDACASRVSSMHPPTVIPESCVCITCGAAGAINVFLRTVCSEGEEVVVFAPFFLEYRFFAAAAGCSLRVISPRTAGSLDPDVDALRSVVSEKTRVVLVNSPNNPSGKILSQEVVDRIGAVCSEATARFGKPVWLVSDEPYSKIVYGNPPPKMANVFLAPTPHTLVVTSFSKDLSIPGERIGYIALNPGCGTPEAVASLMGAITFWQRVLGIVNAPAIIQLAVAESANATVDVSWYDARRRALCNGLRDAGLEISDPEGAFYAFPKVPDGVSDQEFARALAEKCVLSVPGSSFGMPGYLRFSYAVKSIEMIEKAVAIIKEVTKQYTAHH